jgi:hypothetical protein
VDRAETTFVWIDRVGFESTPIVDPETQLKWVDVFARREVLAFEVGGQPDPE